MIQTLLTKLTSEWSDTLRDAGLMAEPPLSVIQVGGLRGMSRKVNFLVFDRTSRIPLIVLKIARSVNHQSKLAREFACLKSVCAFPPMIPSVPQPLGMFQLQGHTIVAESFVPGVPLALLLRRQKRARVQEVATDLSRAQAWLESLHLVGGIEYQRWSGEELNRMLDSNTSLCSSPFRYDVASNLRRFDGLQLPVAAAHGDFWPGNLLVDRDRIGVIDWESFQLKGNPLRDTFLFVTTYARIYPFQGWKWMTKADAFRRAFLEKNWFSEQLQRHMIGIFKKLELPAEAAHLLYSEFLLSQAREEERRDEQTDFQWREYLFLYTSHSRDSIFRELQ